jgi:hypothetical protein
MHKLGRKIKMQYKIIKIIFTDFLIKEIFLRDP